MNNWLNDLIREIESERPGIVFGDAPFDKTDVLDFLYEIKKEEKE